MSATIEEGKTYKLVNAKGGTCIDLSGTDNNSIIGYNYHGGGNQRVGEFDRPTRVDAEVATVASRETRNAMGLPV
jgi:hypothetical protein